MPVKITPGAAAPPPRATANKTSAAKAPGPSDITKARTEAIADLGQFAQVPLMLTKNYADVGAVTLHWPKIAGEIAKLAESNEQIAKLVDPLMHVGPYAGIITAVMPFAVQIAVNHGRAPSGAMGSVPPVTLSSQIETAMAQTELEALKIQRDAEQQAREVREEIAKARRDVSNEVATRQTVIDNG